MFSSNRTLYLVPIYFTGKDQLLNSIEKKIESVFGIPVRQRLPWFDPEKAFHGNRGQYHSTALLEELLGFPDDPEARVLGITSVDLFVPVLTYVFGEAQLKGRVAIVSTYRLAPEYYGLPPDEQKLRHRTEKEVVHELGHTFGLIHCQRHECVMHSSTYAEDIDLKSDSPCEKCSADIRE